MNDIQLLSMKKAFEEVKRRQRQNLPKIGDLDNRLKRLKDVRERSVGNKKLMDAAIKSLKENGFNVFFAEDSSKAIEIIKKEIGKERLVVKSKSNITKEINLVKELEADGIEVVETDIGDRLIQLLNENPSHPTGPAVHLSLNQISSILDKKYGVRLNGPKEIIKFLLKDVKESIQKSKIGISGANAITAEGSILVLHNEGNIFEVANRPEKWIIVAGIDKFYPNIEEAINSAKIQTFYATGNIVPSFIEIISGVSKTADIEKKLIKGIHNPKECTVILIDNKRKYLIENGYKELFHCIGCGNCVINCPAYRVFGEEFKGGRFALYSAFYEGKSNLKLCLSCKRCKKNCPLEIDIPKMISNAREGSEIYNFLLSHAKWITRAVYLEFLSLYYQIMEG